MQDFPIERLKMGIITIFHWSRSADNFVRELLLHSIHRENHELKMCGFILFEIFRYKERYMDFTQKKYEPMVPIFVKNTKGRKQILFGVSLPGQIQVICLKSI